MPEDKEKLRKPKRNSELTNKISFIARIGARNKNSIIAGHNYSHAGQNNSSFANEEE